MAEKKALQEFPSGLETFIESEDTRILTVDPEKPDDYEFICYGDPEEAHGKWMIHTPFDGLTATWQRVTTAKREGRLEGSLYLKTSTAVYRPGSYGPGPCTSGVIMVFTDKRNKERVGEQVCLLVEHDIKYKTNEYTRKGIYTGSKHGISPSEVTFLYNNGSPSLVTNDMYNQKAHRGSEDKWKLNVISNPNYTLAEMDHPYGKWVIQVDKGQATGVWHILRRKIESEKQGILKMECPKNRDRNRFPIHIYTTEDTWTSIGEDLIEMMKQDITYEYTDRRRQPHIEKILKAYIMLLLLFLYSYGIVGWVRE